MLKLRSCYRTSGTSENKTERHVDTHLVLEFCLMEGKESSAVCLIRLIYLHCYWCKYSGEWKEDAV